MMHTPKPYCEAIIHEFIFCQTCAKKNSEEKFALVKFSKNISAKHKVCTFAIRRLRYRRESFTITVTSLGALKVVVVFIETNDTSFVSVTSRACFPCDLGFAS